MFKAEVPDSPELQRVRALPRRVWQAESELGWLIDSMSWYYRLDPDGAARLLPQQAAALRDALDHDGAFCQIPVGEGKTLITFLLPLVLEAERPLLVVPAKLKKNGKTCDEFLELGKTWKTHEAWSTAKSIDRNVVSYEILSRERGAQILAELNPDLLILDEAYHVKNPEAAVTRKLDKFVQKRRGQKRFWVCALTGTSINRSLKDFAHIMHWCRPDEYYPLPLSELELEAWAAAVDVIKSTEKRMQGSPGALVSLCNDIEKRQDRDGIRSAVRRRIQETPGVIACEGSDVSAELNIELTALTGYNDEVERLFKQLRAGTMPNGDPVTDEDLSAQWRNARTLTSCFYYYRNPPPPSEWLKARHAWKGTVRSVLSEHQVGLESEKLIALAASRGHLGPRQCEHYERWKKARPLYDDSERTRKAVWVDDLMLKFVDDWRKRRTGIIWVSEVALGKELEKQLGLPYYHELGLDRWGNSIINADPKNGCVVASVGSVSEGNNLQRFCDNLVISPPPTGVVWEQLLGREHRRGQESDEVSCEVLFGCLVEWRCWQQALIDAAAASVLESKKKLMVATVIPKFKVMNMRGELWL